MFNYKCKFQEKELVSTVFYKISIFFHEMLAFQNYKNIFHFIKKALFALKIFNFL